MYRTSIKSVDLPEPDNPVNTVRLPRGMSREICLKFFSDAFRMEMGFMDGSFCGFFVAGQRRPYQKSCFTSQSF